jgi:hypothetical protein
MILTTFKTGYISVLIDPHGNCISFAVIGQFHFEGPSGGEQFLDLGAPRWPDCEKGIVARRQYL